MLTYRNIQLITHRDATNGKYLTTVIKPIYRWLQETHFSFAFQDSTFLPITVMEKPFVKKHFDYRESTLNPDSSRFASVPDPILPSWQYEETSRNQFTGSRHSFQLSRYASLKKRCCSLKRKGFYSLSKGCFWRNIHFDIFSFIHLRRISVEYLTT